MPTEAVSAYKGRIMGMSRKRAVRPTTPTVQDVYDILRLPPCRNILWMLAEGPSIVSTLIKRNGLSQPKASRALTILHNFDLVRSRRDGNRHLYRLSERVSITLPEGIQGGVRRMTIACDRGPFEVGEPVKPRVVTTPAASLNGQHPAPGS